MKINIKKYSELSLDELYEILKIRAKVFVVEQKCNYVDADGFDTEAYHVFLTDDNSIVAYLRVLPKNTVYDEVCIGRVIAVKRGEGLGAEIVKEGIKVAKEKFGAEKIIVSAQTYAKGFYEKCGFKQISEEYMDEGIPHIKMIL